MIEPKAINAAATLAVKTALENAGMKAEMLAKEVYENIPRPSAKVMFGETNTTRTGVQYFEREYTLYAIWNAPDLQRYKVDCLEVQHALESYLLRYGLTLGDGTVLPVDGTKSTIGDAALIVRFTVTDAGCIVEDADPGEDDTGEFMEKLNLYINTEEDDGTDAGNQRLL